MTRKDLLNKLYESGLVVTPYKLDYLIETRKLQRPNLDPIGRRIFTDQHVQDIAQLLHNRDGRLG